MLGVPYDTTILFSWISEHRWSSFIDNGNEAIWLIIPGVSLILLKIVLMLLLVRRKRSMFSTVCKKIRHENRYDQCVPTSVIKATRRGCCPSRAGSAWTPTPSELWFPQLSHFLKTDESYCYPSWSQWEWHVPTNQTFAPINCMMEDRFISHDFPSY